MKGTIALILERILSLQGYDITAVTSGEDALPLIQPDAFDVAILDLNLGHGMSGMEVLAHFREEAPDTSILLLTGNGTLETAVEALRQGRPRLSPQTQLKRKTSKPAFKAAWKSGKSRRSARSVKRFYPN